MSSASALCLLAAVTYASMGVYVFALDRRARLNRLFLGLAAVFVLWATAYAFLQSAGSVAEYARLFRIWTPASIVITPLLFHFTLELTHTQWLARRSWVLAPIYMPAVVFIAYNLFVGMLPTRFVRVVGGWLEIPDLASPWQIAFTAWYITSGLTALLIIALWGRQAGIRRHREQARTILIGGLVSLVLVALDSLGWPVLPLGDVPSVAPLFISFLVGAFYIALTRYRLMAMTPAAVAPVVLETMEEAVLLVDPEEVILVANPAAHRMLGASAASLVATSIVDWVRAPTEDDEPFLGELASLPQGTLHDLRCRRADGTEIPVVASVSGLSGAGGDLLGAVVVLRDVSEAKLAEAELQRLALQDSLTGLVNRKSFFDGLTRACEHARRQQKRLAVFYLDLDDLKHVNDAHGHAAGDLLLKEFAGRLQNAVRASDTVGRLGGDEFGVVLESLVAAGELDVVKARIHATCLKPLVLGDHSLPIRFSLGTAVFPDHGTDAETLLRHADLEMYGAKALKKSPGTGVSRAAKGEPLSEE